METSIVRKPRSSFVAPLFTDMYQLSMAYAHFSAGRHNKRAVFDLYFRTCPFGGAFCLFAGLDECMQLIQHFSYSSDDIEFIRTLLPHANDAFFSEFLPGVTCSEVRVFARSDGSVVFPLVPLLRVEGPLAIVQLLETALLNLVGFASLIATNAARHRLALGNRLATLVEFGTRRAQGPDGAIHAAKYSWLVRFFSFFLPLSLSSRPRCDLNSILIQALIDC
jgi:nicotinate phosphoribosyltransferase